MMLSRDQILGANDTASGLLTVDVPQWGGEVLLRVMSGRDRERFESACEKKDQGKDPGSLRALLASLTICDAQGKAIFTQADIAALAEKSSLALQLVYLEALKLNKLTKESVDDLEKNSGPAT